MSDLIERQKAIEMLKEYEEAESDNFTRTDPVSMMTVATIANCIEAIVELPSAEPERKTGKWIYDTERVWHDGGIYVQYHCSECRFQIIGSLYNYCPHCGADNRGEE